MNYKVSKRFIINDYVGVKPNLFNINIKSCTLSKQDEAWKTSVEDLKLINWKE